MKSNKGKGLLGLLGLLVVLGIFGFFGYDTLQKSKLVTDENGVTSQNGGIKLGLDLAGGVRPPFCLPSAAPAKRGV